MNKISIIVPIYNVEQYLSACIESVINQTYENLEIILVNDGSTDSCAEICENYSRKDSRIQLIHKENGGLSDARNIGFENSTGNFISFIDSDDIIAPNFCEKMLQIVLKYDADIVECNFMKFDAEEMPSYHFNNEKFLEKTYHTENALQLLMTEQIKQMACNKMFAQKVLQGINFEKNKKHEDEFWTYQVIGNSKGVVKINDVLYFYRQNPTSIMGTNYNISRLDGLLALKERIIYMKNYFPKVENIAIKMFCTGSLWHYQQIEKNKEIDPQKVFRKKIWNDLKAYNKISIYQNWKLKEIFWFQFFINAPNVFAKLRNYINIGI